MRRPLAVLLASFVPACAAAQDGAAVAERRWDFVARLDGKPIGRHRFTLELDATVDGGATPRRTLRSDAEFVVTLLGIPVYRYRHHAVERWAGDCLAAVSATTDDDGTRRTVHAEPRGDGLALTSVPTGATSPPARVVAGCLVSFAYWNPAVLRTQHRLLNDQTGELAEVSVVPIAGGVVEAGGRGLRILGAPRPVEVWYAADGEWIGLDAEVDGGRRLSYRLQ